MPNMTEYGVKQKIPYAWYRDYFRQNQNLDDAGQMSQPMSEQQWSQMDPNSQYAAVSVASDGPGEDDPLVKDITGRYNAAGFSGQGVMANQYNKFRDDSKLWTDPVTGIKMTSQDNIYQSPDRLTPLIGVGTVLTAGMLGNALMAANAGGALGAASEAPGLLTGVTPSAVNGSGLMSAPLFGEGAGAGSLLSGVAPSTAGAGGLLNAPLFNLPEAAGAGFSLGPGGGLDPETLGGAGGMGSAQNGIGPGSLSSRFAGALNNPSSLLSSDGLLASGLRGAGSWALNNPLQTLGLLQAGSGLINGSGGNTGGGGGSPSPYKGKGGGGGQFTPNPYTVAQLQKYQRGMT